MGRADLHEAVARAIADALPADVRDRREVNDDLLFAERTERAAAVAVRVVLADAKRSMEALDWHIAGEGPPEDEPLLIDRSDALAVLAALEPPPPV